jgi:hypothetical protein
MHSHQGKYILYYINHQSINPLTSINHLTSINQTIGINDNMIQQHELPNIIILFGLIETTYQQAQRIPYNATHMENGFDAKRAPSFPKCQ